jgi:hypothetical protein
MQLNELENALIERMEMYHSSGVSDEEIRRFCPQLMEDTGDFDASAARRALLRRGFKPSLVVPFAYRPFDNRWLYWESSKLLNRPRPEYFPHVFDGNLWLAAVQQNRKSYDPPFAERRLGCIHIIERSANMFPSLLRDWPATDHLFAEGAEETRRLGDYFANLTDVALAYLDTLKGVADAPLLFRHVIAVLHAPGYASENAGALRQDWPRLPLPATRADLVASAELGQCVAALLDPETPVGGVSAGRVRTELKLIGVATKVAGGQFGGADFAVTARWGLVGKGGVTMPAIGRKTERPFSREEIAGLGETGTQLLGPDTVDVYLNDAAYWRNVPRRVWEYKLGGYQVLKKWLSYREQAILGRPLSVDEVGYVTQVARRIVALVLMGPDLDENYRRVKARPSVFAQSPAPASE